jgi:Flp pilus assembly protein TadB
MATGQEKREEEIERLAREAGRLIREADPETREELREAATAILREEAREAEETKPEPEARRAMNPLAAGLGLFVIGLGLAFIVPFVGLSMLVIGIFAIVWGGIMSAIRKN